MQFNRAMCILGCVLAAAWFGNTASAQLALVPVVSGLTTSPLYVTQAPGDTSRLFIVNRTGQIRIVKSGSLLAAPFLDIGSLVTVGGETGLLGMAFHPDYQSNGYFYVNYNPTISGQLKSHISRFKVLGDPATSDIADPASEAVLLEYDQPYPNHKAGMLAFGPNDHYLYFSTGDGGSGYDPENRAQNLGVILGKMLRIDVDLNPGNMLSTNGLYAIPANNPFVGQSGALPEIWAYGLRNPWRFSFDRANGDLYIGDVGQSSREEVDYQAAASHGGENYGWRIMEGTRCDTTVSGVVQATCDALDSVPPIHDYPNPADGSAVMGGYVYRGSALPALQGTYFFCDAYSRRIWTFKQVNGLATDFQERTSEIDPDGILQVPVSFGEDNAGELYIVDLMGTIYRLTGPSTFNDVQINGHTPIEINTELRLTSAFAGPLGTATYAWFRDGNVIPGAESADYIVPEATMADTGYYHVEITTAPGTVHNSPTFYVEVVAEVPIAPLLSLMLCAVALGAAGVLRVRGGGRSHLA